MKRKIFISINIPDKAKKRITKAIEKWQELPVKWTREGNLHITILFLGYVDNESTTEICQKVREVSEKYEFFDLEFDNIELAPSKDKPQTIWLSGKLSEELRLLHEKIEKELHIFTSAKKSFRPHITLGRIRKHKWDKLENKPEILEKFPLVISAETVDVMASDFKDGKKEYVVIESCPLK